ncbi:DUF11 domain-containing protein [Occultella kanbiaonis]|uniref:DUF7927 domain-containing protein n=1 Tax=Occultella kanbiaonis TaxID=2675754 RepID=UPI0013D3E0B8|nr:DUF11 domain-containing protein [Occultella kanbiaonis]
MLVSLLAMVIAMAGSVLPAQAAPVYEITGTWINPPGEMKSGDPVVADWRVNLNDDVQPPSNDPVDNVLATFTIGNGEFAEIPDICLTEGVEPASSISADGLVLTCNLGTVNMGTAVAVQTPVIADGPTGSELTLGGAINGQEVALPPIPIVNPFLMDVDVTNPAARAQWDANRTEITMDFSWTLYLGRNSDPGAPNITLPLQLTSSTGAPISIGESFDSSSPGSGCLPRLTGGGSHPWSEGSVIGDPTREAPFAAGCELVVVDAAAGRYDLVLTGIDYSLTQVPTHAGNGDTLPADRFAIATGAVWFQVDTVESGSLQLDVLPVTYTAPGGQTVDDDLGNNTVDKAYTREGSWVAAWNRAFTGSGGTAWDDSYRVAPGTLVQQNVNNNHRTWAPPGSTLEFGNCLAFDTRWVTFESTTLYNVADPAAIAVEYYTGASPLLDPANAAYDPDAFDCGVTPGWSTTPPADLSAVGAVRIVYPFTEYERTPNPNQAITLFANTRISDDAQPGQDIWMFGSILRGQGTWHGQGAGNTVTPTPDARYPETNGRRDILRIATVFPAVEKEVERATVVAGVPVGYTLAYSANGTGQVPETVDGYVIEDTLPPGMHYEPGSASPEPVVTPSPMGDVLTWTLDGVATNVRHTLAYQAVADSSMDPGELLTNTVVSRYGPSESLPAEATVTTSSNGYTTILKTSDVEFIPNQNGDGVGEGSWTVTIESNDPFDQDFTDTIDILPYNGDQRGTSFSGSYELGEVALPDGGTVYYTDADPATLTYDPADPSNGAAGDPSGNTVGWTTTRPDNPTAIRVIGGVLASGGTFSFQVPITTDGAQPQDVYVNSAQARAEHTTLVMRTSAALIVTDYVVEKTSDVPDGESLAPGDEVTYTITVTQQGDVPAGAVLTDDLTEVLDDADVVGPPVASIGTVTAVADGYRWEGVLPVGGTATITYTVRVKDVADLRADGDTVLTNVVDSPGCVDANSCLVEEVAGYWEYSKTSVPAPGQNVRAGEVVTYQLQIHQRGEGAVAGAAIEDDLSGALDDATWNGDATATSGAVSYAEPTLTWNGPLAVGEVVDLTYSVTVTGGGDWMLANVAIPACAPDDPDCEVPPPPGDHCIPAPDQNENCLTEHLLGDYRVSKISDPESGSAVEIGDVVTYTVRVWHLGLADIEAELTDDLTDVLDDATWNDDAVASAGELTYAEPTLSWSGVLSEGDEVTLTYSVTVIADGDLTLRNVVTPPGDRCVPVADQDEACITAHEKGRFTYSKTSDPAPGSEVDEGDVVTYTVTVTQVGPAAVAGASVVDDISAVLPVASWNDDARASSGDVVRVGDEVRWTGDLAVGQVVTITYSVTVGDREDAEFRNVVTSTDPRGACVDAADGNPDCRTDHHTPSDGGLASTGLSIGVGIGIGAVALILLGVVTLVTSRRREDLIG